MNLKLFLILLPIYATMTATMIMINVYATGAARDYDEAYEDVPGAPECWYDGYEDGQNNGFNQDRNEECGEDKGDQYYRAFIQGCIDANNSKDICERFTDE